MQSVKFKGEEVKLCGSLPAIGEQAEDFSFVKADLSEASLSDFDGKIKVLMPLPSLDTGICKLEAVRFNKDLAAKSNVVGIVISKDLPFAMKRFCAAEGVDNIVTASDFRYNDFANSYNIEMAEGVLKGLFARAIIILDAENKVCYTKLVEEVTSEPNYEEILTALEEVG